MNARANFPSTSTNVAPPDDLADAREETWRLLGAVAHYCRCAQLHLEVADDAVTLYDMRSAREYFISAIRTFEPVRAAIRREGAIAEGRQLD